MSSWTVDRQGSRRVEITGCGDKRLITAIFCGLLNVILPPRVIYKGKTDQSKALFVLSTNNSLGEYFFCYVKKIVGLGLSSDKAFSLMIDEPD